MQLQLISEEVDRWVAATAADVEENVPSVLGAKGRELKRQKKLGVLCDREERLHSVRAKPRAARARGRRRLGREGRRIAVIYGDCGTGGALDAFLERENIDRIPGPHCYEMFMGKPDFESEMEDQLGTFFLTDYMVRHFERIVMQGMGLRKHPQLRDMYFGNYTRVLYIAQTDDPSLQLKARSAADALGLAYEYRFAGLGMFPAFIADAVASGQGASVTR